MRLSTFSVRPADRDPHLGSRAAGGASACSTSILERLFASLCILAFVGCSAPQPSPRRSAHVPQSRKIHSTARPTARSTPLDQCNAALRNETRAMHLVDSGSYSAGYHAAQQGLAEVQNCEDDSDRMVLHGYLLSARAYAEHHLPYGDSQTDMNQANQLLVECQTRPGLYGTHIAAECDTQEQNNIEATTNWEMGE